MSAKWLPKAATWSRKSCGDTGDQAPKRVLTRRCGAWRRSAELLARRIDHDVLTVPCPVVTGEDLVPRRATQRGDRSQPLFDPSAMFLFVRTLDLDFRQADSRASRDGAPGIAGDRQGINGIGNHDATEAEIVLRNRVADTIARVVDGHDSDPGFANREFDGIDTNMHGTQQLRQLARNRRLSHSGQAAENDQHRATFYRPAGDRRPLHAPDRIGAITRERRRAACAASRLSRR